MADFFSNLARQVLGAESEVQPLLPPRFARWPNVPAASTPAQPPERVDGPARADTALFPPPLIASDHAAIGTPLPTFRQMSQVGSAAGSSIEPDVPPMPRDALETAGAEQRDVRQDAATPQPPTIRQSTNPLPGPSTSTPATPPSSPALPATTEAPPAQPVVQKEDDGGDADVAATVLPVPTLVAVDRRAKEVTATEIHRPIPAPPSTAPAAVVRPASQAEPLPAAAPGARQTQPAAGQSEAAAPPAAVRDRAAAVPESQAAEMQVRSRHVATGANVPPPPGTAPGSVSQPESQARPLPAAAPGSKQAPPEAVHGHAATVRENRGAEMPVRPLVPEPASGPLTVQPAAPEPGPVIQRHVATGANVPSPVAPNAAAPPAVGAASPSPPAPSESMPAGRAVTPAPGASAGTAPPAGPETAPHAGTSPDRTTPRSARDEFPAHRSREQPIVPLTSPPSPVSGRGWPVSAKAVVSLTAPAPEATPRPPHPATPVARHPPGQMQREAPDDGRALPDSSEPTIVPAPKAPLAGELSPARAGAAAYARQQPALPPAGEPEPGPTIRVTIGRVVVQAAPAIERPAAQRHPLPRPPLSLDEYLARRKGDGR